MNKNKYTYVWVSLILLIFGIIFIPRIVDRVKNGTIVQKDRLSGDENSGALAYLEIEGKRRKVPSFAFVDQDSLPITDKDYLGKVYVVEFFFTSCPTICPLMNKNLVGIQDEFKDMEDFGVASFTIDPDHDTPSVLKKYAEDNGITDMDWHLLTGDRERIYDLANNGFNLLASEVPDAPGGFEHSGMFALVDKNGYIRCRLDAYGNPKIYYKGAISEAEGKNDIGAVQDITILKSDIRKLLKE